MKLSGNTIVITGGGGGIGRGLAESFVGLGNKVIVADVSVGRLPSLPDAIASFPVDQSDPQAIADFAKRVDRDYSKANVLVANAGIFASERLLDGDLATSERIITVNLLGTMRVVAAFLPMLAKNENATIMITTSAMGFMPRAFAPTYSATKAALHSYAQSLRVQLRDIGIQVVEIIPPYVQTTLISHEQATDPRAMPLSEFIAETITLLRSDPDAEEIFGERAGLQRLAEAEHRYTETFVALHAEPFS